MSSDPHNANAASVRADELRQRLERLHAGEQVSAQDVQRSQAALELAIERRDAARVSTQRAQRSAAEAHDRAADAHRTAARDGSGDVAEHQVRADAHQAAARMDRDAASVGLPADEDGR